MAKSRPARKPIFSDKLARRICVLIADGSSLEKIGEMPDMPSRRLMRDWLAENAEFERLYEIARRQRTDALVDEAIEIADSVRGETENSAVQAARLAVDTRRWLASKLLPERFGDRQQVEMSGRDGEPLIPAAEQVDNSKLALLVLNILGRTNNEAPRQVVVEHEPAEQWRGEPSPKLLPATVLAPSAAEALPLGRLRDDAWPVSAPPPLGGNAWPGRIAPLPTSPAQQVEPPLSAAMQREIERLRDLQMGRTDDRLPDRTVIRFRGGDR